MQGESVSGRAVTAAFTWLFAALAMVALMSPPGATQDEWYHATSIWCARGEREPYCSDIAAVPELGVGAFTNLDPINCQTGQEEPLLCPPDRDTNTRVRINDGLYPKLFYFALSWFVVPSTEVSFYLARAAGALVVTTLLALAMWLLPSRHRLVLFLVMLTSFVPTGYFLFASINPSSWTAAGVGVGWLAIHAALAERNQSRAQRGRLLLVGLLGYVITIGSRWDGIPFVALATTLGVFLAVWSRFPNLRRRITFLSLAVAFMALLLLMLFSSDRISFNPRILLRFSGDQPDNVIFFSRNLLDGLPNALRALGTVPSMDDIAIPEAVYVLSLMILGWHFFATLNRSDKVQAVGLVSLAIVIGLVIAAQVALLDDRDSGFIEPRYAYPLLLLAIGWWFLSGPEDLSALVGRYLRLSSAVSVAAFAIFGFAITERFVDWQTYGVRYLPESRDQWWWSWLPVGPNVVVILAPVCLWFSLRSITRLLSDANPSVSSR